MANNQISCKTIFIFYGNAEYELYDQVIRIIIVFSAIIRAIFIIKEERITKTNFGVIIFSIFITLSVNQVIIHILQLSHFCPYYNCNPVQKNYTPWFNKYIFPPLLIIIQIPTFLGHLLVINYAIKTKRADNEEDQKTYYENMIRAEVNVGVVSALDAHLREAPLQIIQFIIIFNNHDDFDTKRLLFMIIGHGAIAWSITSLHGSLRNQQDDELSWKAKTTNFLSHFCFIMSRNFSIGAAMTLSPPYGGVVIIAHWVVATIWVWDNAESLEFCDHKKNWRGFMECSIFGIVYIFTPINLKKQARFYSISFVENIVAVSTFWFFNDNDVSLKFAIFSVILVTFGCGVVFWKLNYRWFCYNNNTADIPNENDSDVILVRVEIIDAQ